MTIRKLATEIIRDFMDEIQKIQFYMQETVSLDALLITREKISLSDIVADDFILVKQKYGVLQEDL